MARGKMRCKGVTKSGKPCGNWALQGSYYCHLHQGQRTAEDQQNRQQANTGATVIVALLLLFGFLISMAAGCEQEFLDWATR